jgi:hypothetical protein
MFVPAAFIAFTMAQAAGPPVTLPDGKDGVPCIVSWNQSPNGPGSGRTYVDFKDGRNGNGVWTWAGSTEKQPGFPQQALFRLYVGADGHAHLFAEIGGTMGSEINTPRATGRGKAFVLTAFTQSPLMAQFTAVNPPSSIAGWCGSDTLVVTITHP